MNKVLVALACVALGFTACIAAVAGTVLTPDVASSAATSQIPAPQIAIFQAAGSATSTPWEILAAIAWHESRFEPTAVGSPVPAWCGGKAMGEMQFASSQFSGGCAPGTFEEYEHPAPAGGATPPTPMNAADAIYAAGRYLASLGIAHTATNALEAYSGDMPGYASTILATAASYDGSGNTGGRSAAPQTAALLTAESQLGVPYVWGGETPGVAFDCSGLVQWAFASAGIQLPRVAQTQFDAGPPVGVSTSLVPGDLVFFGSGVNDVTHVGIFVSMSNGHAVMINAPHTGTVVSFATFDSAVGSAFGTEIYVGATAPGS